MPWRLEPAVLMRDNMRVASSSNAPYHGTFPMSRSTDELDSHNLSSTILGHVTRTWSYFRRPSCGEGTDLYTSLYNVFNVLSVQYCRSPDHSIA